MPSEVVDRGGVWKLMLDNYVDGCRILRSPRPCKERLWPDWNFSDALGRVGDDEGADTYVGSRCQQDENGELHDRDIESLMSGMELEQM